MKKDEEIDFVLIERASDLEHVASDLVREEAIGVDLEADSMFHYFEKVCLIQISTPSQNILIDPLAVKDLSAITSVFGSPKIRKIFHGADYDIRSLYRDFGIEVNNLFDTQIAATFLGFKETGLAGLIKDRFGIKIEKKYQKKDWSNRPLSEPMLRYAVLDSFFLLPLAKMLEEELKTRKVLFCVEEECERQCRVRPAENNGGAFFLKHKGAGKLGPRSLTVLESVLKARDEFARKLDRPPFKVMANAQVDRIVAQKPRSESALVEKGCLSPKQVRHFGHALLMKIEEAMNQPREHLLSYPKNGGIKTGPEVAQRMKILKKWRKQKSVELGLDPGLICSNVQIRSLALENPGTIGILTGIKELKDWQKRLFGEEIVSVLE